MSEHTAQPGDRFKKAPDAICMQPGRDPDDMFVDGARQNVVKKTCVPCPVRGECLEYALENPEEKGVWGGTTERERHSFLTNKKPALRIARAALGILYGRYGNNLGGERALKGWRPFHNADAARAAMKRAGSIMLEVQKTSVNYANISHLPVVMLGTLITFMQREDPEAIASCIETWNLLNDKYPLTGAGAELTVSAIERIHPAASFEFAHPWQSMTAAVGRDALFAYFGETDGLQQYLRLLIEEQLIGGTLKGDEGTPRSFAAVLAADYDHDALIDRLKGGEPSQPLLTEQAQSLFPHFQLNIRLLQRMRRAAEKGQRLPQLFENTGRVAQRIAALPR